MPDFATTKQTSRLISRKPIVLALPALTAVTGGVPSVTVQTSYFVHPIL